MPVEATPASRPTVGFAGLGRMGRPMARRLASAGLEVIVYNRSPDVAEQFAAEGFGRAARPAELGDCEVVITMLAGPEAVVDVVGGDDGVVEGLRSGTPIVDMSTIGPTCVKALAATVARHGGVFVDAPVTGSVGAATDGRLGCFVGGDDHTVARIRPVLDVLASPVEHVGETGAGAAVKLAVNLVLAATNQAVAEALVLGEALGIEPARLYTALESSAVGSPYVSYKRDAFLGTHDGEVAFTVGGLRKDVELILAHGRDTGVPLMATAAVAQSIGIAQALGHDHHDLAAVAAALRGIVRDNRPRVISPQERQPT